MLAVAWCAGLVVRLWRWDALAGALALCALVALAAGLVRLARRDAVVVVDDEGILLPRLRSPRRIPWSQVASVPGRGRFAEVPHVVLVDQSLVHLPGVPPSLVPHLAAFAALRRSGEPAPAVHPRAPRAGAPDVSDLVGVYAEGAPALRSRGTRILTAVGVVTLVGVLGWATALAVRGDGEALLDLLPTAVVLLLYGVVAVRSPSTRVAPEGLVVRPGAFGSQQHAWSDVTSIAPAGRWDLHSGALLRDGRSLPLPGLPVEVARLLARAVSPDAAPPEAAVPSSPAPRQAAGPPRPGSDVDDGWDGPFRRGRPRR